MHIEDEAAAEASGLAAARRMFELDQASAGLGIELVELAPGRAVARMRVSAAMVNGHAIGHGGYVFLLADTAFALACNSHGPVAVAAGADVSFLAPVAEGDVLTARAVERVLRGRSGIYDVTVTRGDAEKVEGAGDTAGGAAGAEVAEAAAGTASGEATAGTADGKGTEPAQPTEQIVAEFRGRSRVVTGR